MIKTQNEVIEAAAKSVSGFGGILRCSTCSAERPLGNIGRKLSNGWPTCCGYTMTWVTARQLAEESTP